MKYALKPSSPFIDINGSNKIIMFNDEKSLFDFFHLKMKQDLTNPIVKSEKYSWKTRNNPNDISASDVIGIYSFLVSSNVKFDFLSWGRRVANHIHNAIGNGKGLWSYYPVLGRMRSLPINWRLYEIKQKDCGYVFESLGWGRFFRKAKKENLLENIDITYRLPESE